ncbi:hypothetical protein [Nocardia sp. CDC160]|nr:hypothetical protein [Nocardia sp. CDC160]MEC3919354.1 hypothetical protein [Nocardia sp. CDC160]
MRFANPIYEEVIIQVLGQRTEAVMFWPPATPITGQPHSWC